MSEKKAELERTIQELKLFKFISENSNDAHFLLGRDAQFQYVNKASCRMLGYTEKELLTLGVPDVDNVYDLKKYQELFDLIQKETVPPIESVNKRKDGTLFPSEMTVTGYRIDGKPYIFAALRDITGRKKIEEKLHLANEEWKNIFEAIGHPAVILDTEHNIISANRAVVAATGLPLDKIEGRKCYKIFHNSEKPPDTCPMEKMLLSNSLEVETMEMEALNGIYLISCTPVLDDKGRLQKIIHIATDITEKKALEDQLRHAQKMKAIGQLAASVAHDFNNILTAIIGYANLLKMKLKDDDQQLHNVSRILDLTERGASLTQRLLTFSRKHKVVLNTISLNHLIQRIGRLIPELIGEDIELRVNLSEDDSTIMADSVLLEQVLVNIVANARDAMPGGGTLTLETGRTELDSAFVKSSGYGIPGMYAYLSISDTGMGMDEKTRDRIFDPFYTTKEFGKGGGLGLAISYGIIKQHNGYIHAESELKKGTTFKIYFPLIKEDERTVK